MTLVMCINKDSLSVKEGVNALMLNEKDIHFLQRNVVDSKLPKYHAIGTVLLQLLPYIAIKHKDEYLTYARKGKEDRLHGKRSMGFGGHIELSDNQSTLQDTLSYSATRELQEELGIHQTPNLYNDFIYSEYDLVSQVHLGMIGLVEIEDKSLIKPDDLEIIDPQWQTLIDIRATLDKYERWSQILSKHLDK